MDEATTPTGIEQDGPDTLRIRWKDGHESRYPVRELRLACPCARCIEEMTGRPILDPSEIPPDVRPVRIEAVGRYAIQVTWTDGHDTGLFTFERLRERCPCCLEDSEQG